MALFFACTLSLLAERKPDWLAATDATTMHVLSRWWKVPQSARFVEDRATDWGKETTVLTLTPKAYQDFLHRESPVPRDRLACVIDQLAERIGRFRAESGATRAWRPIVGIDIDVTTVDVPRADGKRLVRESTDRAAWSPKVDMVSCQASLRAAGCTPLQTVDDAMRCALSKLASHATVVAIVYPRVTEAAQRQRNAFIRQVCACDGAGCPSPGGGGRRQIHFASPHLMYPAQDMVYDFAWNKKPALPDEDAEFHAVFEQLPKEFPGLGQAMAAALRVRAARGWSPPVWQPDRQRADDDSLLGDYCRRMGGANPTVLDDQLFEPDWQYRLPQAYEFRPIALGKVKPMVVGFDIESEVRSDLAANARAAFANMPMTDLYVLAVDPGTTEDKFQVPTMRQMQSGGWLHGAIAATQWTAKAEEHHYLGHVGIDLAYGLLFGMLCGIAGVWPAWNRSPVLNQVVLVVWPLLVGAAILSADYFLNTTRQFLAGGWTNPLPMLLGMTLHLYLVAPERIHELLHEGHGHHEHGSDVSASMVDRAVRLLLQVLWAVGIVGAVALAQHWQPFGPAVWRQVGGVLAVSLVYVVVARRAHVLPLPWRTP